MKKKRFSVEQIIGVLKQAQVGVPVAEVIRKAAISEQTFYRWKAKYAGLEVDQVRQMAQLQEENQRLKRLVADLTLDKTMLQDVLSPHFASLMGTPCSQKNGEAFGAWTDGGASGADARRSGTQGLPGFMRSTSDVLLSELPGSTNGAADAYPGDGAIESALRISQDPGSVEPRRLERRQVPGVPVVLRRGPLSAADATSRQAQGITAARGEVQGYGSGSGLEYGLCVRPVTERYEVSLVDDRRCLYTRGRGHRSRPKPEGRRCSSYAEPREARTQ